SEEGDRRRIPLPLCWQWNGNLVARCRHLPFLPIREGHRHLDWPRPELVGDTHGVMEARASTSLAERKLGLNRCPAALLWRELHHDFWMHVFRDGRIHQMDPRSQAGTRCANAGRQFELVTLLGEGLAHFETHPQGT